MLGKTVDCHITPLRKEVLIFVSVNPRRTASIVMSLLNVLQDLQGSDQDKLVAIACLFREVLEQGKLTDAARSRAFNVLQFAENLMIDPATGTTNPEFFACRAFIKNELRASATTI